MAHGESLVNKLDGAAKDPRDMKQSSVVGAMGTTTPVSVVSRKLSDMHAEKLATSPGLVSVKSRGNKSRGDNLEEVGSKNPALKTFQVKKTVQVAVSKAMMNTACLHLVAYALPHTK